MSTASIRLPMTSWNCWSASGGRKGCAKAAGNNPTRRRASKQWPQASSLPVRAGSCRPEARHGEPKGERNRRKLGTHSHPFPPGWKPRLTGSLEACPHIRVRWFILLGYCLGSFRPRKDHLEPLLKGGLVIDSGELIGRRLVGQDIGAARIVHVAQFNGHLRHRAFLGGFGLGHMNRIGIEIGRVHLAVGLYASDFEYVTAVGAQPFAFQLLEHRVGGWRGRSLVCGGNRWRRRWQRGVLFLPTGRENAGGKDGDKEAF